MDILEKAKEFVKNSEQTLKKMKNLTKMAEVVRVESIKVNKVTNNLKK